MDTKGINDYNIKKACLEIQDYANKLKNTLNEIDNKFDSLSISFQGSCFDEYKNKFLDLKESFPVIYNNISSYIDDFNALILRYENFTEKLSIQINKNAEKNFKGGDKYG